jgi:hypothetical protein
MSVIPNKWIAKEKKLKESKTVETKSSPSKTITRSNMSRTLTGVRK